MSEDCHPDITHTTDCSSTVSALKLRIRTLQRQLCEKDKQLSSVTENLKFLQPDQIRSLKYSRSSKNKGITWSTATLKSAFELRYSCGVKGYNVLRETGYPLPSYRTLCRRIQHATFVPGIQSDTFQWLTTKCAAMKEQEKDCALMLDEMQIKRALEFDRSINRYIGSISPEVGGPDDVPVLSDHALVFMLRGMTSNWKQVVAYFFTGSSVEGGLLWGLVKQVVIDAAAAGLCVRAVVSDMGSSNQAMWRAAGVHANRSGVVCSVTHPCQQLVHDQPDANMFTPPHLYFLADVPHLLKNIRNCLMTQDIILPPEVLRQHNLPSPKVQMQHIAAVVELQNESELKIAPSLTNRHIEPGQYQKMRVSTAAQVLSHSTASALRYCVETAQLPQDALTTAWFVDFVNSWFDLMNGRSYENSLRCTAVCQSKFSVLEDMTNLARQMMFAGKRSSWKPIQTGILMSTYSVLQLYEDLVVSRRYRYLLAGRLTQDSLENFFSQVHVT